MADLGQQLNDSSAKSIPEWASGSNLRHVEQDVLIPKIMREEAKILCKEYVDAFTNCAKGRTLSLVTACRNENREMKKCFQEWYFNAEFRGRCTDIYLKRREEYQEKYAHTNETAAFKRKESTVNMGKQ
ncbi:Hypothetical predicted protein [Paramuricea clavata]|uniref:COX assembly mitochondrial protein n=1 Tax=Paramuricea clavata TaxID=317549 RepID=A0A7D9EJP5_PARCT|nr:Hypothetical predicted protein [Paramuricea clavata]